MKLTNLNEVTMSESEAKEFIYLNEGLEHFLAWVRLRIELGIRDILPEYANFYITIQVVGDEFSADYKGEKLNESK